MKPSSRMKCGDMKMMALGVEGSVCAACASQSELAHGSMGMGGAPCGRKRAGCGADVRVLEVEAAVEAAVEVDLEAAACSIVNRARSGSNTY